MILGARTPAPRMLAPVMKMPQPAPTTESPMHSPIPIIAHAYGEVCSKKAPMLNDSPLPSKHRKVKIEVSKPLAKIKPNQEVRRKAGKTYRLRACIDRRRKGWLGRIPPRVLMPTPYVSRGVVVVVDGVGVGGWDGGEMKVILATMDAQY